MDSLDPVTQAAAIPWRMRPDGELEVLLICRPSRGEWGIPKGNIKPAHVPQTTAIEEAYEEAGIEGVLAPLPAGQFTYEKHQRILHVEVYDLQVVRELDEYPERLLRQRQWYSLPAAVERVHRRPVAALIAGLPGRVQAKKPS